MKIVNRVLQALAIASGLAALVMFFLNFATITTAGKEVAATGAALAFGGKVDGHAMAKSAKILFCLILTAVGFVMSALSFKSKKLRYAAPAVGLVDAIFMLVVALGSEYSFVDYRTLPAVSSVVYSPFVLTAAILLFCFVAFGIAYLLVDDSIEVAASKGEKLTIPKRVVRFFRDYKSEVKKIVWPGLRDVVKNTLIVFAICLIIGALIWLFDWGLGELLKAILTKK